MFITVHAAAGVIIGKQVNHKVWAFVLAFLSHFILDIIPHGDEVLEKKFFGIKVKDIAKERLMALYGSIDAVVLAFYLIFIFKTYSFAQNDPVNLAIIGAILPDLLVAIYKIKNFKWLKWFYLLHTYNHRLITEKIKYVMPLKLGILLETALLIFFTSIISFI